MTIDWLAKLRHLLQTLAFCLVIAALHVAFMPQRPFVPALLFSICIGVLTWAVIDLGRHAMPGADETGWPRGLPAVALVVAGLLVGYFGGTALGQLLSRALDVPGAGAARGAMADWRTSLLVSVIAGVVAVYWFYSRGHGQYLERKADEAQRLANEARLKLLETQLEPHMLFNTLANLRALIAIDPPRAQEMLDRVIAYLRATLDASRATTHPLQAEFDRTRDYLELMAVRMGSRLAYRLELPGELSRAPVPALLLQPLVENAIQHGLEPQLAGGRLVVSATRQDRSLVLEVLDTGSGPGEAIRGTGFGLAQVRERLDTLYGSAAGLSLAAAQPTGTRATIRLPLDANA